MKFTIQSIFILLITVSFSQAQWLGDFRLTYDPEQSWTPSPCASGIAADPANVHVVWQDYRGGSWQLYYKRSTNGGFSWGPDTWLTNHPFAYARYANVALSGSLVHVFWNDGRNASPEIYYKRSTNSGTTWGPETRLTFSDFSTEGPSVAASGSVLHVAWWDYRDGNSEVYYKRSTDAGISWGPDTRLTFDIFSSRNVSVAVSGSVVHVTWDDDRDGNPEIYYKRSTDGGTSWGPDTRLTIDFDFSQAPTVAVSGSNVNIVWHDGRDGNPEIYRIRSTDGGTNWGLDTRMTINSADSYAPTIAATGTVIHFVWFDNRDGNEEIYVKRSPDGGSTWSADTRLTNDASVSEYPHIAVNGLGVHLVWQEHRDYAFGYPEIYYKRNPEGNFVVPVILIGWIFVEAFYFPPTDLVKRDTVRVYLRDTISPHMIIDSALSVVDTTGRGIFTFTNGQNGTPYYIVSKHRNSIETWSKYGEEFTSNELSYDFSTSANMAYGDNLILKGSRYCMYSGDVTQDGAIDAGDLSEIDNDARNFVMGYVSTDIDGNYFVDANDAAITDNNAFNFVTVISP